MVNESLKYVGIDNNNLVIANTKLINKNILAKVGIK